MPDPPSSAHSSHKCPSLIEAVGGGALRFHPRPSGSGSHPRRTSESTALAAFLSASRVSVVAFAPAERVPSPALAFSAHRSAFVLTRPPRCVVTVHIWVNKRRRKSIEAEIELHTHTHTRNMFAKNTERQGWRRGTWG